MKVKFEFEIDLATSGGCKLHERILRALAPEEEKNAHYLVGVDLSTEPDRTVVTYPQEKYPVEHYAVIPPVVQPLAEVVNYVTPPAVQPLADVAPIARTYTLEQLAVAASTQLVDTGRRQELIDLLTQFGIAKMTDLPVASYSAFATHLTAKGVKVL